MSRLPTQEDAPDIYEIHGRTAAPPSSLFKSLCERSGSALYGTLTNPEHGGAEATKKRIEALKSKHRAMPEKGSRDPLRDGRSDRTIIELLVGFMPLYKIAAQLGVSRHVLEHYVRGKPELHQMVVDVREALKDEAESKLLSNIQHGNQDAIEFLLDRLARDRGYGEHSIQEIDSKIPIIQIGKVSVVKTERKTEDQIEKEIKASNSVVDI